MKFNIKNLPENKKKEVLDYVYQFELKCVIKYQNLIKKVQQSLIKRIINTWPEYTPKKEDFEKLIREINFKKYIDYYPIVTEYKKINYNSEDYYYNDYGKLATKNNKFVGFVTFDEFKVITDIHILPTINNDINFNNIIETIKNKKY